MKTVMVKLSYPEELLFVPGDPEPPSLQELVGEIERAMNASHFGGLIKLTLDRPATSQETMEVIATVGEELSRMAKEISEDGVQEVIDAEADLPLALQGSLWGYLIGQLVAWGLRTGAEKKQIVRLVRAVARVSEES